MFDPAANINNDTTDSSSISNSLFGSWFGVNWLTVVVFQSCCAIVCIAAMITVKRKKIDTYEATVKPSLSDYANSTPLHGFSFMGDSSTISIFLWLLLIFFSFSFATNDFVNLVNFYRETPTMIGLAYESNQNFILPTPTVCMEIGVTYQRSTMNTSDIEVDIVTFLHATNNGQNLQFDNFSQLRISPRLLYFSYSLLAYWTDVELSQIGQQQNFYRLLATKWSPQDPKLPEAVQLVSTIFSAHNVSLPNLKKLVGMAICQQQFDRFLNYQLTTDDSTLLPLCKAEMISHLSFSLVCSKLFETPTIQLNQSSFSTFSIVDTVPTDNYGYAELETIFERVRLDNIPTNITPTDRFMPDQDNSWVNFRWHLDMLGRPKLSDTDDGDIFTWDPVDKVAIEVSPGVEYKLFNSRSRPCGTLESQYDCEWREAIERNYQKFGCWPSSLTFADANHIHPSCPVNLPKFAFNTSLSTSQWANNNSQLTKTTCLPDCNIVAYSISARNSVYREVPILLYKVINPSPLRGNFELTIHVDTDRTVITESPYKNWSTFASEFGGSVGTWLGGSLLAFLHVPIFIVTKLFGGYTKTSAN